MKSILYSLSIGAIIGALIIWYAFPRVETQVKIETKVVTEYKTRIVERWTKDQNGNETHDRMEETSGSIESGSIASKSVAKPNWHLGVQAGLTTSLDGVKYGVRLERRIVGPVFLGGYATTNKEAGISLGLEF